MLSGILSGLLVGFILTLFNVNVMLIEVLQPFAGDIILTNSHYYVVFIVMGILSGLFINRY